MYLYVSAIHFALVQAATWQERKELLDQMCSIVDGSQIKPGDFFEVCAWSAWSNNMTVYDI